MYDQTASGAPIFANGAATAAFGYLYNHLGHMLVGTDAHNVLHVFLQNRDGPGQWGGNTTWDGLFGNGRPDLIYNGPLSADMNVYEIKPEGSDLAGNNQLQGYLITVNDPTVVAGDFSIIFQDGPTLTLNSNWFLGRTTYTYSAGVFSGVVMYTVDNTSVFHEVLQAFQQRPVGAPSPLPLRLPVFP